MVTTNRGDSKMARRNPRLRRRRKAVKPVPKKAAPKKVEEPKVEKPKVEKPKAKEAKEE